MNRIYLILIPTPCIFSDVREAVYLGLSPSRLKPEGLLIVLSENIWEHTHKDFRSMQATRAIAPTLMGWIKVFVTRNPRQTQGCADAPRNDHVSRAIPSRAALVTAFLVLRISSRRFCTVFPIRLCPNLIEKHCCQIAKRDGRRENTAFPAFSSYFAYHRITKTIIFAPSIL